MGRGFSQRLLDHSRDTKYKTAKFGLINTSQQHFMFHNRSLIPYKQLNLSAVVVAQLVERLLPIPEVCISNPVIGKMNIEHFCTFNWIEKSKIKKKRPGMDHLIEPVKVVGVQLVDALDFFYFFDCIEWTKTKKWHNSKIYF